ncbi:hypothetical protein HY989_03035 [Candidatus Micrarchaeota archaeon]|nr:hypothetical protein [Candidatus Micrarchaeota archaeon]
MFSQIRSAFKRDRGLLQMKSHDFSAVGSAAEQIDMLFSDKELKLLMLWALVSPAAGIGYLIWIKYPKLKLVSLLAFAIAILQFYMHIGAYAAAINNLGSIL